MLALANGRDLPERRRIISADGHETRLLRAATRATASGAKCTRHCSDNTRLALRMIDRVRALELDEDAIDGSAVAVAAASRELL